jgi:hypothetical protein
MKVTVERALALERLLMLGELPERDGGASPLDLAAELEALARAVLAGAVSGRVGTDLRAAADEVLLAGGLESGEGAESIRGDTSEWEAAEPIGAPPAEEADSEVPGFVESGLPDPASPKREEAEDMERKADERPTGVLEVVRTSREEKREPRRKPDRGSEERDWLTEVGSHDTLDWPERPDALKLLDRRPAERHAARERVRHLFPRPEPTEWSVSELEYRRRRERVEA